jgi:hypothetical protein
MVRSLALPSTEMRLPHPDRLSIWPTESGYGLDIQELGRQWTSRVGPLGADDAKQVVGLFVR